MCQITLNSHATFHGDRTIGGVLTVKEAFKNTIFQLNINVNCTKTFIFSHIHMIFTSYDRTPHSEQLCLWEYFHQSKCYLNILNYVQDLLLRTSSRFFARSEPNYSEMFSGECLSIIIENKLQLRLTFAKGRKSVRKRRGLFYLNSYNSWTEWDIFTKLREICMTSFWSNKKICADSPLGGAIRLEKL